MDAQPIMSRAFGQGVRNIVRFNWPFFALAGAATALALGLALAGPAPLRPWAGLAAALGLLPTLISLAVSAWVYDFSGLYDLGWLPPGPAAGGGTLLTLHAGFDETTARLAAHLRPARLLVADFYDPTRHTEPSIRRARARYPPWPGTVPASAAGLPYPTGSIHEVVAFMAAHEIRDPAERAAFFREVRRVLAPGGRVLVVEHLRDAANFLAYTVGALHFHSRRAWRRTFAAAGLAVTQEIKVTPFVSAFLLV